MPRKSVVNELQTEEAANSPLRRSSRIVSGSTGNGAPAGVVTRRTSQTTETDPPARATRGRRTSTSSTQSNEDNSDSKTTKTKQAAATEDSQKETTAPVRRGRKPSVTSQSSDKDESKPSKPVRGRRNSRANSEENEEEKNLKTAPIITRRRSANIEPETELKVLPKTPTRATARRRGSATENVLDEEASTPSRRTRGKGSADVEEVAEETKKPVGRGRRRSVNQVEENQVEEVTKLASKRGRRTSTDNVTNAAPRTPGRPTRRSSMNLETETKHTPQGNQQHNIENGGDSAEIDMSAAIKELSVKVTPLKRKLVEKVESELDLSIINESCDDEGTNKKEISLKETIENDDLQETSENKVVETSDKDLVNPEVNKLTVKCVPDISTERPLTPENTVNSPSDKVSPTSRRRLRTDVGNQSPLRKSPRLSEKLSQKNIDGQSAPEKLFEETEKSPNDITSQNESADIQSVPKRLPKSPEKSSSATQQKELLNTETELSPRKSSPPSVTPQQESESKFGKINSKTSDERVENDSLNEKLAKSATPPKKTSATQQKEPLNTETELSHRKSSSPSATPQEESNSKFLKINPKTSGDTVENEGLNEKLVKSATPPKKSDSEGKNRSSGLSRHLLENDVEQPPETKSQASFISPGSDGSFRFHLSSVSVSDSVHGALQENTQGNILNTSKESSGSNKENEDVNSSISAKNIFEKSPVIPLQEPIVVSRISNVFKPNQKECSFMEPMDVDESSVLNDSSVIFNRNGPKNLADQARNFSFGNDNESDQNSPKDVADKVVVPGVDNGHAVDTSAVRDSFIQDHSVNIINHSELSEDAYKPNCTETEGSDNLMIEETEETVDISVKPNTKKSDMAFTVSTSNGPPENPEHLDASLTINDPLEKVKIVLSRNSSSPISARRRSRKSKSPLPDENSTDSEVADECRLRITKPRRTKSKSKTPSPPKSEKIQTERRISKSKSPSPSVVYRTVEDTIDEGNVRRSADNGNLESSEARTPILPKLSTLHGNSATRSKSRSPLLHLIATENVNTENIPSKTSLTPEPNESGAALEESFEKPKGSEEILVLNEQMTVSSTLENLHENGNSEIETIKQKNNEVCEDLIKTLDVEQKASSVTTNQGKTEHHTAITCTYNDTQFNSLSNNENDLAQSESKHSESTHNQDKTEHHTAITCTYNDTQFNSISNNENDLTQSESKHSESTHYDFDLPSDDEDEGEDNLSGFEDRSKKRKSADVTKTEYLGKHVETNSISQSPKPPGVNYSTGDAKHTLEADNEQVTEQCKSLKYSSPGSAEVIECNSGTLEDNSSSNKINNSNLIGDIENASEVSATEKLLVAEAPNNSKLANHKTVEEETNDFTKDPSISKISPSPSSNKAVTSISISSLEKNKVDEGLPPKVTLSNENLKTVTVAKSTEAVENTGSLIVGDTSRSDFSTSLVIDESQNLAPQDDEKADEVVKAVGRKSEKCSGEDELNRTQEKVFTRKMSKKEEKLNIKLAEETESKKPKSPISRLSLDEFATAKLSKYIKSKAKDLEESSSEDDSGEDESENEYNEFIDGMAEEGEEDTPSENSNQIIDEGESVGFSDSTHGDSEDDYDPNDSFICEDEEPELLSGDEYDLGSDEKKQSKSSRIIDPDTFGDDDIIKIPKKVPEKEKPKKKSRIIKMIDSSSDEDIAAESSKTEDEEEAIEDKILEQSSVFVIEESKNKSGTIKPDVENSAASENVSINKTVEDSVAESNIIEIEDSKVEETSANEFMLHKSLSTFDTNLQEWRQRSPLQIQKSNIGVTSCNSNASIEKSADGENNLTCHNDVVFVEDSETDETNNSESGLESKSVSSLNTSIQKKHRRSSLSIQENIVLDGQKDPMISKRINSLVESFCSTVKKGEISLNLSLEFEDLPEPSSAKETDKTESVNILSDIKLNLGVPSNVKRDEEKASNSQTDMEMHKPEGQVFDLREILTKNRLKRRLSKSLSEIFEEERKAKKRKRNKKVKQSASEEKLNKKNKRDKCTTDPSEDLRTSSFSLMNQLITDVKSRPRRVPKPTKVSSVAGSCWIATKVSNLKPSTTPVSKDEMMKIPRSLHPKDFRNQLLSDPKRVKRTETKTLLKMKGAYV